MSVKVWEKKGGLMMELSDDDPARVSSQDDHDHDHDQ